MLGLGEEIEEIKEVMRDLRAHKVDMLTIGQYLQPSQHHLPVFRYVTPFEFNELKEYGETLGFEHVASGPLVRSFLSCRYSGGACFKLNLSLCLIVL